MFKWIGILVGGGIAVYVLSNVIEEPQMNQIKSEAENLAEEVERMTHEVNSLADNLATSLPVSSLPVSSLPGMDAKDTTEHSSDTQTYVEGLVGSMQNNGQPQDQIPGKKTEQIPDQISGLMEEEVLDHLPEEFQKTLVSKLPEDENVQQLVNDAITEFKDPDQQWHVIWGPFSSSVTANGFAKRLSTMTGLTIAEYKDEYRRHMVAVAYSDETTLQSSLATIESASGLTVQR